MLSNHGDDDVPFCDSIGFITSKLSRYVLLLYEASQVVGCCSSCFLVFLHRNVHLNISFYRIELKRNEERQTDIEK